MTDITSASPARTTTASTLVARAASSRWATLAVLLTGTCLIVLDFFIVNVALPSLQRDLHAGTTGLEWVVAGYGLTFAVFLLAAGRLGDRIGRRRMFALGVAGFTAASAACGLAPTTAVLISARLAQGVAAAMISPSVLALIGVRYDGHERVRAVGIYATVMGVAAAGAQLVGGLLLQADIGGLGWRLVFLVNVPIGLAALAAVRRCVPESRAQTTDPIDITSLLLATFALTALVLPLVDGHDAGWPWWTYACVATAPVFATAFTLRQRALVRRAGAPLLAPALFRQRSFTVGLITQFAFWSGQASYFLVLAIYLQSGRGLSPLAAGVVFSVLAGAYLATSMRAARLTARFGRAVVVTGALTLAGGHLATVVATWEIGTSGPVTALLPGLVLEGAGMGLCLTPITATVLTHADPQRAGAVSGALSTVQQVGNAVGVAAIGLVFFAAAPGGDAVAFTRSVGVLAALLLTVAVLATRLPGRPR